MSEFRKPVRLQSIRKLKNLNDIESNNKKPIKPKQEIKVEINLNQNNEKIELDDSVYDEFIQLLTISKFKEFAENCKLREIENSKHDMHLKKKDFIQVMKNSFPNNEKFIKLYEKIFNRFKLLKAEINHNHKIENNYFINRIFSEEEIDIYEICCALACFVKCYFSEKLKLLYDLTDIDDDGFISENEVKKLIYTVNLLFYEESNPSCTDSTILSQSLASIKSKKSFNMIMKHPGNLSNIIQEEKYINFNQFLSAVEKVYQYKFILMPLFISLKKALSTTRGEKELEIKYERFGEYGKISNDIVSELKKEGEYGTSIFDFKKNLELIKKANKTHLMHTSGNKHKKFVNKNHKLKSMKKKNLNILPIFASPFAKKDTNHDIYYINYNKIAGLETYPGKFNILINENKNFPPIKKKPFMHINTANLENRKMNMGYMTSQEIFDEIIALSNKHKISDEGPEELIKIGKEINDIAFHARSKLREPGIPITLGTYIFRKPNDKKSKTFNKGFKELDE